MGMEAKNTMMVKAGQKLIMNKMNEIKYATRHQTDQMVSHS